MAEFSDLLKDIVPRSTTRNQPLSVTSHLFSLSLNDIETNFILIKYSNRIFITVTELKKIGNLYTVQLDSPQRNGLFPSGPPVFDIKCILGADTEDRLVAVRALAEKLNLRLPLLLSLTVNQLDFPTISAIAEAINANKCW